MRSGKKNTDMAALLASKEFLEISMTEDWVGPRTGMELATSCGCG